MDQSQDKVELAQKLQRQLVNCVGYEGDELASFRKQAYDYYFQRRRNDEIPGRSEIVTGDISSMVEGNLAQMIEPLLSKRIAEYCAYDEMDEEQAQLESDCVTEMLFKRENGFMEVTQAIKDALLIRNGIIKIYVDERTHIAQVRKSNVTPEIITDVLDRIGQVDIHHYDPKTGTLSATVTKVTRKFRVEALAPENFLYPKDWHRQDLEGIPFCAERHVETRATLIERGFPKDVVQELPRFNNVSTSAHSRMPRNVSPNHQPLDHSQELVEWYECYARLDDGNGASQLHCISMCGTKILDDDDAVDIVGYATGVAIVNPHTFMGISLFDKLKSTQDTTTAMSRALMDNLNAANKNRTAHLDGIVEETDLLDGRINNSIRVNPDRVPDVRAAITAFAVPDTSGNILLNLEHMRRVRAEMGGASLDLATGQMQLNDRVGSQGLDRAYSVMEQLAAFMTRVVACTLIRQMYLVAHEVIRTQWQQPISFKRGKDWIQQMPAKWPVRESVHINMGASMGERQRISMVLEKLLEKQAMLSQAGMEDILVNVTNYYHTIMQWLRTNDIDVPEKFIVDPRSDGARKAMQQREVSRQQATQKQDGLMQQALALEQLRIAFEKYKTDSQLQFDYYAKVLDAQIEEAKLTTSAVVDISKAKATGQSAMNRSNANVSDDDGAKEGSRITDTKKSASNGSSG